jgi:dipeptidyl aminopeptidase/acylaminoacyl peptidase
VTWNSGISKDQNRYIVAAQRNDKPTKFFWIDVKAKKGGLWFSQYPYLGKVKLGQTGAFSFKASDGMEIGGYLTMPVNAGDKKPKLIVHPHGGPRGRDYQYFNPWVQFMVNRGYAVLQVNFRGSTGFGSAYERAGYQQWGKAMQQDIYDAVKWVKAQDIVNTNESCLVGASYGGYVAMTAAFQKPDMFDCIVSIAGIPDLSLMVAEDYKWQSNHSWVEEQIGDPNDPKVAKEFFKLSAINNIDKIKAPILLIHGTYDTQVRVKQSKNFYNKARRRKMDVEYIEMDYGTHYLDGDDNRKAAFKAIDDFLAKHLK